MRKKLIALMACCFAAALLCACGGSPLEEAAGELVKSADNGEYMYTYAEDTDTLRIKQTDDKTMDIINEYTADQDIGNIVFEDSDADDLGKLKCKSMKILQIDSDSIKGSKGDWTQLIDKAELVVLDGVPSTKGYTDSAKENIKKLKRLWLTYNDTKYIARYTGLEELGFLANMNIVKDDEDSVNSEDRQKEESENITCHLGDITDLLPLKKLSRLKEILIIPTALSYDIPTTFTDDGNEFMTALRYVVPDVLVNEPGKKMDIDPVEGAAEKDLVTMKDINIPIDDSDLSWEIDGWQASESELCYKQGLRNKKKNRKPVVYGKALVHLGDANVNSKYSGKRIFIAGGRSLHASEIKGGFETADRASDYDTFIYVYPTYKYYGTYTSGTKGYTLTMHAQVFDLKRGITYSPETIASANPPQKFTYTKGQSPERKDGEISDKKIYRYLRNLKCRKAQ